MLIYTLRFSSLIVRIYLDASEKGINIVAALPVGLSSICKTLILAELIWGMDTLHKCKFAKHA